MVIAMLTKALRVLNMGPFLILPCLYRHSSPELLARSGGEREVRRIAYYDLILEKEYFREFLSMAFLEFFPVAGFQESENRLPVACSLSLRTVVSTRLSFDRTFPSHEADEENGDDAGQEYAVECSGPPY